MAKIEKDIDFLIDRHTKIFNNSDMITVQEPLIIDPENPDKDAHSHPLWEIKFMKDNSILLVPPGIMHNSYADNMDHALRCNADSFKIGDFMLYNLKQNKYFAIIFSLMELYCQIPANDETLRRSVSKNLLTAIMRILQIIKNEPELLANFSYFDRALFFIRQNYWDCKISLNNIADFAGCSPQYLSRLFHEKLKKSPNKTLLDLRMKHAFELLKSGQYLIGEVAKLTGYRTQFYFSNVFHEYYGTSPISIRDH